MSRTHRIVIIVAACALLAAAGTQDRPADAGGRVAAFFEAYNSGEREFLAFCARETTERFRARRPEDARRDLYRRLRSDLGRLEVHESTGGPDGRWRVLAGSDRVPDPVTFTFDLDPDTGMIDGFSVNIGQPEPGDGGLPPLEIAADATDAQRAAAFGAYVKRLADDGVFSGVVLVARNGKPFFQAAHGFANRATKTAIGPDTMFDVGSITKLLTKVAIGQLAEEGKLALADTIARRLPDYPDRPAAQRITIEQLLEHRSGLGDFFGEKFDAMPKGKLLSPRDFFPLFTGRPLLFEPGTGQRYSNAGYIVLGAIVEAVSGRPYNDYVERRIFIPAGMGASGFPMRDGSEPKLAIGYTGPDDRPNTGMLPIRGCPAGSSAHTAADLVALDRALRSGVLLNPDWSRWVFTGVAPGQGRSASGTTPGLIDAPIGIAGGAPGLNADVESDGTWTIVVLANLDPPIAEDLASVLRQTLGMQ